MIYVVFYIALSVVFSLNISFSRFITSVGEERAVFFFCHCLLVILLILLKGVSSSSGCFEKASYLSLVVRKPVFGVFDKV